MMPVVFLTKSGEPEILVTSCLYIFAVGSRTYDVSGLPGRNQILLLLILVQLFRRENTRNTYFKTENLILPPVLQVRRHPCPEHCRYTTHLKSVKIVMLTQT